MNSIDPVGVRARFLAAISAVSSDRGRPRQLCEACVQVLAVARAGIAVQVAGPGLEKLCASDAVAQKLEWMQITVGEGPGVDAVVGGGPVLVADLAADSRWPVFVAEATALGVGAMYALPLQIGAIRVGVLDLYRDQASTLDSQDFADAVAVAEVVTALLLSKDQAGRIDESLGVWWEQPSTTREVHQATGMIVAQLGVSAREAYVRLQAYAYAHGRLLHDVAHDVVDRRLRFHPDPDPDTDPLTPTTG